MSYIYNLSQTSINKCRNEGYHIYKHDTSQLEHDYILLKVFLSCSNREKESWQNETALKHRFEKNATTSDAMYIKDSKLVGVEIFTSDYNQNKVDSKMEFLNTVCDQFITFHTSDFVRR